jgi:hypothetical protein
MQLFTGPRIALAAGVVVFVAFLVIGASMGMFGDMFQPFFGSLGAAAGVSGTPAAGTRTGTPVTGTSSGARPAATPTIRR